MPTNTNCVIISLVGDYVDHYLNSLKESKLNMSEFNKRVIDSVTRIINRRDISEDYVALDKALNEREAYDRNLQQKLREQARKKFENYQMEKEAAIAAIQNGESIIPSLPPINDNPFKKPEESATVKYLWIPVDYDTVVAFCNYHNETFYSMQPTPTSIDVLISCAFNAFCKMYVDNNECARYYIHDFFDEVRKRKQ